MAFEGMDVDVVENNGRQLQHQADQLQGIINQVNALIDGLEGVWKGQDAIQFRDWWVSQHRPHLMAAEAAVRGLGQSALNNAAAQRQVSGH